MDIKTMTIDQIEARMAEIRTEMDAEGADISALTGEVRAMTARKEELRKTEYARKELRNMVAAGAGKTVHDFKPQEQEERTFGVDSVEYRNAYLKKLQGKELTEMEQRAFTVASGATATITANRIMDVVRDHAWLLDRTTTIYANGKIEYYIEGTNNEAEDHTENAAITPAADTLTKITLSPAEITKMIQVSAASAALSIDAFEAWLADQLGKAIARKISSKIITAMLAAAASAGTTITKDDVLALLGSVKGESIAIVCNNKTLFTKLAVLQDNGKSPLVRFDGGKATIYGREVLLDDNMADDTVLCGDMSKFVCAVAEDINVIRQYDIDTNSTKYLGVTVFDGKVGLAAGFAKLAAG